MPFVRCEFIVEFIIYTIHMVYLARRSGRIKWAYSKVDVAHIFSYEFANKCGAFHGQRRA